MTATAERTEWTFDSAIPSRCACGAQVSQWESPAFFCPECGRPLFDEPEAWTQLMNATPPRLANRIVGLRSAANTTIAKQIRAVFKAAGVKGVRVTSGGYCVHVRIPSRTPWHGHELDGHAPMPRYRCPICNRENQVHERATRLILAALPDLDDRSDSQSDYFDFRFLVN